MAIPYSATDSKQAQMMQVTTNSQALSASEQQRCNEGEEWGLCDCDEPVHDVDVLHVGLNVHLLWDALEASSTKHLSTPDHDSMWEDIDDDATTLAPDLEDEEMEFSLSPEEVTMVKMGGCAMKNMDTNNLLCEEINASIVMR